MSFVPLYELLPELAEKETRTITVLHSYKGVPKGEYGLMEMYCNDKRCDCRRVFLCVIPSESMKPVAYIAYGWETFGFYAKWYNMDDDIEKLSLEDMDTLSRLKGPCLNTGSPQSKYAPKILKLVEELVLTDPVYVQRLEKHYMLFKRAVDRRYKKKRQ